MDLHAQTGIKSVPTLRTERLTLRTFEHADAPVVLNALNNWDVTKWLTHVPFPYALGDFERFLREICNDPDDHVWAMESEGTICGTISLGQDLGYWLDPAQHGRGLMTEAAISVCQWHFDKSDAAINSGYHLGNSASKNVLGKLGFQNTHVNRGFLTARGDRVDTQRMTLTKAGWQHRHG